MAHQDSRSNERTAAVAKGPARRSCVPLVEDEAEFRGWGPAKRRSYADFLELMHRLDYVPPARGRGA